jgi:hypothetical protein
MPVIDTESGMRNTDGPAKLVRSDAGVPLAAGGTITATNVQDAIDQLATLSTAGGTALPIVDGTATVGTSPLWAHEDHIHPTDTSRAPTANPSFTGTVTIGSDPHQGGSVLWDRGHIRAGGDLTLQVDSPNPNGSYDEFLVTLESNQRPTNTSYGYFKGPLYCGAVTYDNSTSTRVASSNGISIYSSIATGVTLGYAEGIVVVAGTGGDTATQGAGVLISGEFDIAPSSNDTDNGVHGGANISGGAPHLNLWCANFGVKPGGWILDTQSDLLTGGIYPFNNGVSIRGVAPIGSATTNPQSSNIALQIPNATYLSSRNAANNADVGLLYYDSSNVLQIGGPNFAGNTKINSGVTITGEINGEGLLNVNNSVSGGTGYHYIGANQGGAVYPITLATTLALGSNFTGGAGELTFFNCFTGATDSFRFYQQTGASAATLLMDMTPSGVSVAGDIYSGGTFHGSAALTGTPTAPTATAGTNTTQVATTAFVLANPAALRSYLAGLTLSTAGSSATFSVAAGIAADSTNVDMLTLAASISKTTGAWAVGTGNGALDTGAIAASTWYHVWLIKRTDTSVVDVLVSLSATAPTMPTSYTEKRRIGSMKTNGSSQWTSFVQLGDEFLWGTSVLDVNVTTLGTTATLYTLSVPTSVQVRARCRGYVTGGSTFQAVLITSPDETSQAVNVPVGNGTGINPVASAAQYFGELQVRTNTSGQVRAIANLASTNLTVVTYGWFDDRGKSS